MSIEPVVVPFPKSAYKLPLYPASWYLFCASAELRDRPLAKSMFGRELVAFRTKSGAPVILDSRCSHAGAPLGNGRVVGDTIQCPFHGWRYGADGACVAIPSGCAIPEFARQRSFAVDERQGFIFVFNGAEPLFPLPWFEDAIAGKPFAFTAETSWPSVTGHAFDLQHFLHVHDRRLVEPPVIDTPAPYVRRIRYRARVVPRGWRDRVLSRVGGPLVTTTLAVHGGTFTLITAEFEKVTSRFIMTMRPIDRQQTLCQGIVFGTSRLLLPIRRFFTHAYLRDESETLGSATYAPERFIESDRELMEYFGFLERISEPGELL
ncbi:MAG TPA: Rieske 2Fe-2S domain-containing protein [Thermoanaerobaculia bacterium]|nr:Rieske 2Fe-2S domain-containing protein [Thermoanaerobaculia bacterium]